ncbi:glycosyltransferase family 2 protein [Robertmurraya kyonggiensis]|nr:glycosyltransferase family 2 protein [Robertmurraya kyonggiensis]
MATINRMDVIEKFMNSLLAQEYKVFELIIVDQNDDNRLENLIEKYSNQMQIIYIKSVRGLSRARNVGLSHATGDIIAFPDDDCWYPKELLKRVKNILVSNNSIAGLTGKSVDEDFNISAGVFDEEEGEVNKKNVWRRGISITIFLRKEVINKVGTFDEMLGVGSGTKFGSGEETDFLLRVIDNGYKVVYFPSIIVHHPNLTHLSLTYKRGYLYGCGLGILLNRHNYPMTYKIRTLVRPLGGILLSLLTLKWRHAPFYFGTLKGRVFGMLYK